MPAGERSRRGPWISILVATGALASASALALATTPALALATAPALALATAPALAPAAPLAQARPAQANTFSGLCQLAGTVSFTPAITALPQTGLDAARATGTCSGQFTERGGETNAISNAPVSLSETQRGLIWCAAGASVGTGELDFPLGKIGFRVSEQRGPGAAVLELTGEDGGGALGAAGLDPGFVPQAAELCTGAGLSSAPIHLSIATTSISG